MSTTLRDELARRIHEIGPADLDLQHLVGLGERRRRRRRPTAGLGSGAAVVPASASSLGGASRIRSTDATPGPTDHHTTDRKKTEGKKTDGKRTDGPAPQARKIVYSDGPWPTRTLHVGDRTVDISDELPDNPQSNGMVYLDTAGDGVVFTTDDGRIWFTNGIATQSIGQLGIAVRVGDSPIRTGRSGSLAAWQERAHGSTRLVVYDTRFRTVVARLKCFCSTDYLFFQSADLNEDSVGAAIVGDHVYWTQERPGSSERGRRTTRVMLLDVASNTVRPASRQVYLDDLASQPRGLVVGDSLANGAPSAGIGLSFSPVEGRLVPLRGHGEDPANEVATKSFDGGSGVELNLRLPAGYHSSQMLNLFEWVDDDRLALVADGDQGTDRGQILVCRVSTQQCQQVVPNSPGPRWVANFGFP